MFALLLACTGNLVSRAVDFRRYSKFVSSLGVALVCCFITWLLPAPTYGSRFSKAVCNKLGLNVDRDFVFSGVRELRISANVSWNVTLVKVKESNKQREQKCYKT